MKPHRIPGDLETLPIAARLAKVHIKTLRSWIHRGYVTLCGRPKSYRVSLSEVIPIVAHADLIAQPRKTGWNRSPEASAKTIANRSTRKVTQYAERS